MKYKITVPKAGSANELGSLTRLYELDEVVDASEPWQKDLMALFVENGWAMEIKVVEPKETVNLEAKVEVAEEAPKPKPKKKAASKAKAKKSD
tara:strand:- start:3207 stop:3485 length:279 start_codon:yes stop_codon:yes gene_type:complete